MASRIDLQAILEKILGTRNVYYQPPMSIKINYPAIIYSRKEIDNKYANNSVYSQLFLYEIIVVDKNPDSKIVYDISKLPMCNYDRHYISDNLNHDSFTLYF